MYIYDPGVYNVSIQSKCRFVKLIRVLRGFKIIDDKAIVYIIKALKTQFKGLKSYIYTLFELIRVLYS